MGSGRLGNVGLSNGDFLKTLHILNTARKPRNPPDLTEKSHNKNQKILARQKKWKERYLQFIHFHSGGDDSETVATGRVVRNLPALGDTHIKITAGNKNLILSAYSKVPSAESASRMFFCVNSKVLTKKTDEST